MAGILSLFLFVILVLCYGGYAIPYVKHHQPPEGTARWVFWLDVILVEGLLVVLVAGFPAFAPWLWPDDFIGRWEQMVVPWLEIGIGICVLGRIIPYLYYKFHNKFKKY